jgi:hypothetical protein
VLALTGAAYLFLLRFDSAPGRLRYLGYASFCFGLLIACKVSLIPMAAIPALFAGRLKDRRLLMRAAGICAGCMLVGVFVGVPDAFFHPAAYWHGVEFLRKQYAGVTLPHASIDSTNSVSLTAAYFWQTTGSLPAFSLAGAVLLAKARRFAVLAATAGPVVFYLAYFASQRTFFERNLSHVVPLMAILAALALTTVGQKSQPRRARRCSWRWSRWPPGERCGYRAGWCLWPCAPLRNGVRSTISSSFSGGCGTESTATPAWLPIGNWLT